MTPPAPPYRFDDRHITWQTVPYIGAQIWVLTVDPARAVAQVLIRFAENIPGRLHRHVCDFSTFVLQGELRFWRPDGTLKEVRRPASHIQVAAHGEPHTEGAGEQSAIVLFTFHGTTGDTIQYLDEAANVVFSLSFQDFEVVLREQGASGEPGPEPQAV